MDENKVIIYRNTVTTIRSVLWSPVLNNVRVQPDRACFPKSDGQNEFPQTPKNSVASCKSAGLPHSRAIFCGYRFLFGVLRDSS